MVRKWKNQNQRSQWTGSVILTMVVLGVSSPPLRRCGRDSVASKRKFGLSHWMRPSKSLILEEPLMMMNSTIALSTRDNTEHQKLY
jgi:hypothetical protein